MEKLQLNKTTFAGFMDNGLIKVGQETWDGKSFTDILLSKEDILKLAEAIKAEEEKIVHTTLQFKVYVWSNVKGEYVAAGTIQNNTANLKETLKKCDRFNEASGMDWDTSKYIVKERTVGFTEWTESKIY